MTKRSFIFIMAIAVIFITVSSCSTQGRQFRTRTAIPGSNSSMRDFNCLPHGYR